jgi:hypothetical protein
VQLQKKWSKAIKDSSNKKYREKIAAAQCGKSPKKRHFSRFFKEGNLINNFYPR